jgi:hypothetical protein
MLSTSDFVEQFDQCDDLKLFEIHSELNDYSDQAKEAFTIVANKRGGLENLLRRYEEHKKIDQETYRIGREIDRLATKETDTLFFEKMISSDILSKETVSKIIEDRLTSIHKEKADLEIKPATIYGSIFGGIAASIVGGIFWGLQLIFSQRIFIILLAGVALVCYGIIRLFTKQSWKNQAVLITTCIAFLLSLLVGWTLFSIVGYQK